MSPLVQHGRPRDVRFPGAIVIVLMLVASVGLALAAAHAMCAIPGAPMAHRSAAIGMAPTGTADIAQPRTDVEVTAASAPSHPMQGLLDCLMAGITGVLVALLLIALFQPPRVVAARVAAARAAPGAPAPVHPHRKPSLTVLCISRT